MSSTNSSTKDTSSIDTSTMVCFDANVRGDRDNVLHPTFRKTPYPKVSGDPSLVRDGGALATKEENVTDTPTQRLVQTDFTFSPHGDGTNDNPGVSTLHGTVPGSQTNLSTTVVLGDVTNNKMGPTNKANNVPEKDEFKRNSNSNNGAGDEAMIDEMQEVDLQADGVGGGAGIISNDVNINVDRNDDAWKAFCDKIRIEEPPHSTSRQNVELYLEATKMRRDAQAHLENAYLHTQKGLFDAIDAAVQHVKNESEQWSLVTEAHTNELVHLAKDNHHRRQGMVHILQDQYRNLEQTYSNFMASVLNEVPSASTADAVEEDHKKENPNESESKGNAQGLVEGEKEQDGGETRCDSSTNQHGSAPTKPKEPDWDELLQFEPMRESTQLLHDAHSFLQDADGRLTATIETVSSTLQGCMEQLEVVTSDAFQALAESELDAQQDNIQQQMMCNMTRRIDFEIAVREQAQQSQNFFQQLASNIRNAMQLASCNKRSAPGEEEED